MTVLHILSSFQVCSKEQVSKRSRLKSNLNGKCHSAIVIFHLGKIDQKEAGWENKHILFVEQLLVE